MNIFIFAQSACGGAERMSVLYAKILSNNNTVTIHSFGKTNILNSFVDENVSLVFHKTENATDSFIKLARKIISESTPDIIFCSLMPLNWRLAIASLGCKAKVIFRSDNYIETQSFSQRIRLAFAYRKADVVIAQTEEMREGLARKLKLNLNKIVTIQNPIDVECIEERLKVSSPYNNSDRIKFVSVGRFAYEKGFDLLLKAYSIVLESIPESDLYIVGDYNYDNSYFSQLQDIVEANDLKENVHFTGYTDNPYIYMKYADCFVLSSRNEGLPNVLIESLYCGTPAAALKCIPVIERIIKEDVTGYLAEKEDIQGLAFAMINSIKLGRVVSTYNSNSRERIIEIFNKTYSNE